MDCYKRGRAVAPMAAAVPDVVSSLEQIDTSPGAWLCSWHLVNAFFPQYLLAKTTRSSLLWAGKASNTPSLPYPRDVANLQPFVVS